MKVPSEIYLPLQQNRLAGMLSMHVDTNVPSFARSFQDVACKVSENKVRRYILLKIMYPKFRNSDQKPYRNYFICNSKNWLDSNGNSSSFALFKWKFFWNSDDISFADQYQLFLAINDHGILLEFSKNSDRYAFYLCTQTQKCSIVCPILSGCCLQSLRKQGSYFHS